jgi:hypothetical protein
MGADDDVLGGIIEGRAVEAGALGVPVARGEGRLVSEGTWVRHDPEAGEPA